MIECISYSTSTISTTTCQFSDFYSFLLPFYILTFFVILSFFILLFSKNA